MLSFTIIPSLGIKDDVPPDDLSMFEFITESIAKTHCTDSDFVGYDNIYTSRKGCANKVGGLQTLITTGASVASGTMSVIAAFGYLYNAVVYHYLAVGNKSDEVKIYECTSTGSCVVLSDGLGNEQFLMSAGGGVIAPYVGFSGDHDRVIITGGTPGIASPFCVQPGEGIAQKLIAGGTDYNINFITSFENRIFGANTDITNGDGYYDIRYSNLNPTLPDYSLSIDSSLSFGASNQLFYPDKEEITGIKKLNNNRLFVYARDSIAEIKYTANYSSPFSIKRIMSGYGALCNNCIIGLAGLHFFYDRNNGFCSFDGANIYPLSKTIQEIVDSIDPIQLPAFGGGTYGEQYDMPGAYNPRTNEIVWSVSYNATTNTDVLYYNIMSNSWRKDPIAAKSIYSVYEEGSGSYKTTYFVNDGEIKYNYYSTSNSGTTYTAYRIEPVLNFGGENKTLLNEIWARPVASTVGEEIDFWYRGGDSVTQLEAQSWTSYGSFRTDTADPNVVRSPKGLNTNNRYHQVKWGSDSTGALFSIEKIEFKYVPQGRF